MNPTDADLVPLPPELRDARDQLRVAGYEYAIHKIESIDEHGQLHLNRNPFFTSATRVPDWTRYYLEKERPAGLGIFKAFFREPARAVITLIAPPYGLTLLGLAALGDRSGARQQRERRERLPLLSELPKFVRPYSRNEA
jgi:hypothetical protein